jgi:phage portal protein BeeE
MQDLGIYFCAFWLKVKDQRTGRLGLLRLPPETVEVSGWLRPDAFFWYVPDNKPPRELDPSSVVYFHGFNPDDPIGGLSPIETLRQTLAEESAASAYRAAYWTNAARFEGIIERPATAKPWTPEQKQAFREQWQMRYSGVANAGMTPVLDEGMTFRPVSHSARESEYIGARKLSREECAAAYHIPQPMVGILDHATFCLPGETEVFTEEGPRPISEVRRGDRVWSLTEAGDWTLSLVTRSGCTGQDEILRLHTGNRTLRLNGRHRVLARRAVLQPAPVVVMADGHRRALGRPHKQWVTQYVPAGELQVGDTIVVLRQLPTLEEATVRLPSGRLATEGFLELCGLLLGDGNVTCVHGEPVGLQIARGEHAPYMAAYRRTLQDLLLPDQLPGTRGPVHLIEGGRQTRVMSVAVGREFDRLGFSGTARTKRVPGWIFGLPATHRLALLRGFLDADGSCDRLGRLSFSSCSRPLLSQIWHLCLSVGVPVTNLREQRGQTRLPTGRMATFSQWNFTCSDPGANRRIGSHTPEYQRRMAAGQPFARKGSRYPWQGGRGFASETTQLSAIVRIDHQARQELVYDLTVDGTHSFIAEGVVVHNSNVKEQHKQLYQDSLGPWCAWISEEIELQVLSEFADQDGIYTEFNIAEKMKGSFEDQAVSLARLVGRPIMTANEGRARLNLPAIHDDPSANALAAPLNMTTGAETTPSDAAPEESTGEALVSAEDAAEETV